MNLGGLRFRDASENSGIRDLNGFRPPRKDYDQDGDLDLLHADDQGGLLAGPSRGLIQVLANDGTGRFAAVTDRAGTDLPGTSWMASPSPTSTATATWTSSPPTWATTSSRR